MNIQNKLLLFHNLMCSRTVQLALGTALRVTLLQYSFYLPCGSTDVIASPMTQPSRITTLSPVLFMHVGDPYIPPFHIFDLPPFLESVVYSA